MSLIQSKILKITILKVLGERKEVRLPEIAAASGLQVKNPSTRRAIQRVFKALIKEGYIIAVGQARTRAYQLNTRESVVIAPAETKEKSNEPPMEIPFSEQTSKLLSYVNQPIHARKPIGYIQDFLKSYEPNSNWYLSREIREKLLTLGKVENTIKPAGTYARTILNRLLIDLSWNSSRLEGNTYSLLETKRLIEQGESAVGKDVAETQMIINHKSAIEYIIESAEEKRISFHEICSIHALLSENLLGDPSASGRIRQISVGISDTTYLPLSNPHLLKQCFEIFLEKLNRISDPFEQSFFSLVHLSYLQAFEDVNKRTSRLVANIPLIKANLKPLSFIDVDQQPYIKALVGIYEKNDISLLRDLYIWAYMRSAQRYTAIQQTLGEPNLFKLKYRNIIQEIVRKMIIERIPEKLISPRLQKEVRTLKISKADEQQLLQIIETEIISLHEGNIARFKIKPSEFQAWKMLK